jgi:malonyl-CoA O-methyltransferase
MKLHTEIGNSFNRCASKYDKFARVQQEIGERLFERLQYLAIQPRYILDLGCGSGLFSQRLKKLYPKAQIVGLDLAYLMLNQAKLKQQWRCKWGLVNGDMTNLPFANGTFDLIFSNQVIHWSSPLNKVMQELNRVLRKDGCLMFSTLGPDTFKELRTAFNQVDKFAHVNDFLDLHIIGDCLVKEYFLDPVMDMEYLTVKYAALKDLLHALKNQGVKNINPSRKRGLTGKDAWNTFTQQMVMQLTYEVIYGHAWKGDKTKSNQGVETSISLVNLKQQLLR